MPNTEEIIDDFCSYFYGQIEGIRSIEMCNGTYSTGFYQRKQGCKRKETLNEYTSQVAWRHYDPFFANETTQGW